MMFFCSSPSVYYLRIMLCPDVYSVKSHVFLLQWLTLLPPEYQHDVYGVSWTIIAPSIFWGFLVITILAWSRNSSKRASWAKEKDNQIEYLKAKVLEMSDEKLDALNKVHRMEREVCCMMQITTDLWNMRVIKQ